MEFVLRSGDLDNRRTGGAQKEAMQAGSRLHRKIQRRMGKNYQAEVSLKHIVQEEQYQILLEGRADGIIREPAGVTIDEIKCIYMDLSRLEEADSLHMAQAMCYGFIYCYDHELDSITIQITYCNIETEEIRRFSKEFSYEELKHWFEGLIHEYVKWAQYLYHNQLRRGESIKELLFPYPYREGQKELAVSVYRSISRGRNLYIQAPTGIGKTLSTIYPSLKAIGEGYGDKLFYLTAKTITRSAAQEALAILRKNGLYFKAVTITAKEKLCFLEKPECNPDVCPYARGHFDRVNDAVFDVIHQEFAITREVILAYAEKYQICPFEFCLDVSNWVDGIICDYNYVFDPNVRLKRYFAEGVKGEYLFLVDEAHNLVSRARSMYSAYIKKEDILLVNRIIKDRDMKLSKKLNQCNKLMLEMKRECEGYQVLEDVSHFALAVMAMFGELERFMEEHQEFTDRDLVLDFYFQVRDFLNTYECLNQGYRIYTEMEGDGSFLLKLFCIDPSGRLKACLDQGISALFFSATLLPVNYYKELLSGDLDEYAVYAHSPFDEKKRLLCIGSDVSSRYTRRNEREFRKIACYIRRTAEGRQGNYMVFFPSYQYLGAVADILMEEETPGITYLKQASHMDEAEREEFLEQFAEDRKDTLIGLCVMGGIFSEGIDLKEGRLIGAVIVGTGLPMVCTRQEILKNYFDETGKNGFSFAYQYPGMNKVMQAAGRVIRTVNDRGVIVLLDERFLERDYQAMFPREWQSFETVSQRTIGEMVKNFWEKNH